MSFEMATASPKSNHETEMSQPAPPYNERYEELYDALRMFQDHFKRLKEARVAEQQKRLAENQANQSKILEEWRACQERDQIRIAEIEKEAAPRDQVRLAQLEEEEKKKQAAEDERQDLLRKIKEAKKQAAKDEREFRKDMRERNQIHKSSVLKSTKPVRVQKARKAKRVTSGQKRDLEKVAREALAHEY